MLILQATVLSRLCNSYCCALYGSKKWRLVSISNKISTIKMEFPLLEACLPVYSFVDIDLIMPACTSVFDTFHPLSCDVLSSLISKLNKTTCVLDPFPTKLLMSHLSYILDIILCIVNQCFSSGIFQHLVSPPSFSL